ncbi:MAG: hypothetical protein A2Z96_01605 [Spirochaetes bacterium GWB1_48_6]|nr:MAG: hypothetical protein A2Z96_01605 [Spirochaetes bacterium GWB1_48_6]
MKGTAKLAWKNLSRYKKRTAITSLALGIGLGIFIWMDAWLLGAEIESERNLVWYETSSLRVVEASYWEKKDQMPLARNLKDPQGIMDALKSQGYRAAPRIQFAGEMIFYQGDFPSDGYQGVRIVALDPLQDEQVFQLKRNITEGRYMENGAYEVVLGSWLAQDIGAKIGSTVIIETRDQYKRKQTMDLTIVGFITTDNPVINRGSLFIPLDTAQEALDMEGVVTEINLALDDYKQAPSLQPLLQEKLGAGVKVLTWRDLAADYLAISTTKQGGSKIMLFLVIIIAAVGISNTMLMAVFERIREVGMMQALGMTVKEIKRLFLWESAGIGVIGGSFGVAMGAILVWPMVTWGVDFTYFIKDIEIGYRLAGVMRAAWNPGTFVTAFIFSILLSLAVAQLTLRKMLKWNITQCLTHQ